MNTRYISTKQLRDKFSDVTTGLTYGDEFILLYRSKPIAKIVPFEETIKERNKTDHEIDQLINRYAGIFKFEPKKKITPEHINQIIDEQYNEEAELLLP